MSNNEKENELIKFTSILFASETGLGSLLHGLKIPLTGHLLSLNQIFFLTRLTIKRKNHLDAYYVSQVVSLLKSLSPAGKKLTPMLAISMQGFLFHFPLRLFGINVSALILSGCVAALWAFIQPLLLYFIIFGNNLFSVIDYYLKKLNEILTFVPGNIFIVLLSLIILKIILSIIITFLAIKIDDVKEQKWEQFIANIQVKKNENTQQKSFVRGLAKDLTSPLFLITLILSALFFYYQEHSLSKTIWTLLRPIAAAVIVFSLIRLYPLEKFEKMLKKDSEVQKLFLKMIQKIKGMN